MQAGRILVAEHEGAFVLKLVGDVRLNLCCTLDAFFEELFNRPQFLGVVVDLTETEGIDSTTLGLLAKLAIQTRKRFQHMPLVVSTNADITRILRSMGLDQVMSLREEPLRSDRDLAELPMVLGSEGLVREKVIEAHRVLMGMNDSNRATFSDLLAVLESGRQ